MTDKQTIHIPSHLFDGATFVESHGAAEARHADLVVLGRQLHRAPESVLRVGVEPVDDVRAALLVLRRAAHHQPEGVDRDPARQLAARVDDALRALGTDHVDVVKLVDGYHG